MTSEIENKIASIFKIAENTIFECNDGWQWLVLNLLREIDDLYEDNINKISILQIKEKYGILRIYASTSNKELDDIIEKYEHLSKHTCEICGAEGKMIRDEYWIMVRCEDCL